MANGTTGEPATVPFSADSTRTVLAAACAQAGLDATGAMLLRLGENALYRLAQAPVVVRIARTMDYWDDVTQEVQVARWLAGHQFPAAQVCDIPQPIRAAGLPVTFWRYIEGQPGTLDDAESMAVLLRRLHSLPAPTEFALKPTDVLDRVQPRIEAAAVSTGDKDFLLDRWAQICAELARLEFPLSPGLTHGDAHTENLIVRDGEAVLIDFERFSWGQPEWDLALPATEYLTAGWWSEADYGKFVDSYGYDITTWAGFPVLRAAHEVKMTTWLMQNVGESVEIAREFGVRVRTIRTGRAERTWQAF